MKEQPFITHSQARQLLHNKFVVILGDSVQRSVYKDLVLLLQRDRYLTPSQLKSKLQGLLSVDFRQLEINCFERKLPEQTLIVPYTGEYSFERDSLVEGGRLGPLTNGIEYKEVRQYKSDHQLLRFYFLTRIYSSYMESVLEDFRRGPPPDIIIISSCVWDITRYGQERFQQYKENLHKFFSQIKTIVRPDCLLLWSLAMPLSKKIKGGFLVPEISHLGPTVCCEVIKANLYSSQLADAYGLDVLDLHFHFRLSLQNRMPDGVHWDAVAHRRISTLLLQHVADAWGVKLQDPLCPPRPAVNPPPPRPLPRPLPPCRGQLRPRLPVRPYFVPWRGFPAPRHNNHYMYNHPFPRPHMWPPVHQNRVPCSQMDFTFRAGGGFLFHPPFPEGPYCMRRRRSHFRTHPYAPCFPQVLPRHLAFR